MPRFMVVAMKAIVYSVEAPDGASAERAVKRAVNAPLVTDQGWDVQPAEQEAPPFGEPDLVLEHVGGCLWCARPLFNDGGTIIDDFGGDVCGTREAQDRNCTGTNPPHVVDGPDVETGQRIFQPDE